MQRGAGVVTPTTRLSREQLLDMSYYLTLTRSLEERLGNLYRQGKVIGGLYRSLGQEGRASPVPTRSSPAT